MKKKNKKKKKVYKADKVKILDQLFSGGHGNSALLALPLILTVVLLIVMISLPDCSKEKAEAKKPESLNKSIESIEARLKKNKEETKAVELAISEEISSLLLDAKKDCVDGEYKSAKDKIEKALKLYPGNKEFAVMLGGLKDISGIAPSASDKTKEAELLRRGISYYLEGDLQSCLDIFAYILNLQPENIKLSKWFKEYNEKEGALGDWNYKPINPVKDKLMKALGLFYEGKYEETVALCKEVLAVEPDNMTALERMGSAYYKLGQKQNAKTAWEKAYKLEPKNNNLKKFIDKLDKEINGKTNNNKEK